MSDQHYRRAHSSLLKNEVYCREMKIFITDTNKNSNLSASQQWEFSRFPIRKHSVAFGKRRELEKRAKAKHLVTTLLDSHSRSDWSEEDKIEISNMQTRPNQFGPNKAQGAFGRSRAEWVEDGKILPFLEA